MPRDPQNQMALYKVTATVEIQVWGWDESEIRKNAPGTLLSNPHSGVEDWHYVETTKIEDTGRYE